jgi:hypothetical protein
MVASAVRLGDRSRSEVNGDDKVSRSVKAIEQSAYLAQMPVDDTSGGVNRACLDHTAKPLRQHTKERRKARDVRRRRRGRNPEVD